MLCFSLLIHIHTRAMGSGYMLLIIMLSFTVAMITYSTIISTQSFKHELPVQANGVVFSVDPVIEMPRDRKSRSNSSDKKKKRMFHTAVTASEGVYNLWQCRIMYYWFKRFKNGPNSEMGGFTRILHSGFPDDYMDEIPTFVVQPLPDGLDQVFIRIPSLLLMHILINCPILDAFSDELGLCYFMAQV